jgi:hypothetical protein
MAVIDWLDVPSARPASVQWDQVLPEALTSSVFNQSTESIVLGNAYWLVTVGIGPRRLAEVPDWEAFILQFADTRNRVRLWDWRRESPRGTGAGAPVVSGAGQTGTAILTSGWLPSQTVLAAGDWVGINGELRRTIAAVTSDGAGAAVVNLDQPVRTSPPDTTALVLTKPKSIFICTTDKRARGFKQEGARATGPTLEFMEVFA